MARPNQREDVARALDAAREGDHETLLLLSAGRKAASAPLVLGEALFDAVEGGHIDALNALLQFGAPAAGAPGADGDRRTPLAAACAGGHAQCVAVLLVYGAPVDAAPYPKRRTALHTACACGHADCAALLIHHGADVDLADSSGETPLAAALNCGHAACATLLLDHGARAAADCLVCPGFDRDSSSCWGLVPRLLAAGAVAECRHQYGLTPLAVAAGFGTTAAVRALCAVGANARAADSHGCIPLHGVAVFMKQVITQLVGGESSERIGNAQACADELIERGGAETLLTATAEGIEGLTALDLGLILWEGVSDDHTDGNRNALLQLRDGCLALMLARWPLSAPLPEYDGVEALLPAAAGHAQRRHEVLRSGLDDGARVQQQALTAAFLRRVRDACGGAVAPAHAPFARFRFVAGGGLEQAWAGEREVHRFPVERVALQRAALQVASDAQAAAAERCVPLLRELSAARGSSSRWKAEKLRYAAAVAVGRWGTIRAAVSRAEEGVRSGEAALSAAVTEAEAQVDRLMQAKAAAAASDALAAAG